MPDISRRTLISGAAALTAIAKSGTAFAATKTGARPRFNVIDGLGGFTDPYGAESDPKITARARDEMRQSGVYAVNITMGPVGNVPNIWEGVNETIKTFDKIIADNADFLLPIRTAADFDRARASGMVGVYYGTQDTSMIGPALDRVAELKAKGVRNIQLTYNLRNLSGDGALEPDNAGLSKLGHATIERIETERLQLDLSHGGAKTIAQAVAFAKRPPLISHAGCRDLHDNPRNVYDASLKGVADKGGVAGIYFMPFLTANSKPTGEDLIRHIEHMANVCGEDHVSIGTDGGIHSVVIDAKSTDEQRKAFEARNKQGISAPGEGPDIFTIVADYNSLDKFQRLGTALGKRGWTSARIDKLFAGNLMRLYRETWSG